MASSPDRLRAVVAVPLPEHLVPLIQELEPRIEVIADSSLTAPMRGPADWLGDPSFQRTEEEQKQFDAMVDSADFLFGIPDVDSTALARTAAANQQLKWVMTTAAGGGSQVQAADLPPDQLSRIVFTTSAGVHGGPLAEFAVFGVFAGAKNLPKLEKDKAEKYWPDRWVMRQVADLKILVVGLGGIGAACAQKFHDLGAEVWGTTRSGEPVTGVDRLIPIEDLAKAVQGVDAVVATLPGTAHTEKLINAEIFDAMKPGMILVNVGRGTVIDQDALIEALGNGHVGFAALDVFENEPLPKDSPLWNDPNVLISPHTAALDTVEDERIVRMFAKNATNFLDGQTMINVVDTVEYY